MSVISLQTEMGVIVIGNYNWYFHYSYVITFFY